MASAGNTMTNNSILFNNYIEAVENHPELYSKPWIIEDNKGRTWFICGEANSANSSEVAVLKKNIYHTTKSDFDNGAFKCHICSEHARKVASLFGPNNSFIFPINLHEAQCYPCIDKLHDLTCKLKTTALKDIKNLKLRLLTDKLLYMHEAEKGSDTNGVLKHYIGHSTNYHLDSELNESDLCLNIDKALQDLTGSMYNFFIKILNFSDYETILYRLNIIKDELDNQTYGEIYRHACNWFIDCLKHIYNTSYTSNNLINILPGIAYAIVNSNLGEDENKFTVSYDLQQCNNAIFNWLKTASSKKDIINLITATLNPSNYKQRKAADNLTNQSNNSSLPSARHFEATRKALGNNGKDFTITAASLQTTKMMRPKNTFIKSFKTKSNNGSSTEPFDALIKQASQNKKSIPFWDETSDAIDKALDDQYLTLNELFNLLENIPQDYQLQICSEFKEFATLVEINNTDPSFWLCKPEPPNSNMAYSWQFMGDIKPDYTSTIWYDLTGAHTMHVGNWRNAILIIRNNNYNNWNKLRDSIKKSGKAIGVGSWALSSKGERSHGKTLANVCAMIKPECCELVNTKVLYMGDDTPILGIGLSANTKSNEKGKFHNTNRRIKWRIRYPDGKISKSAEIKYFDKPENVQTTIKEEVQYDITSKLKKLKNLYESGALDKSTYDRKVDELVDNI